MKFQRLHDLREDSDLSQKQLGEILHISQRAYSFMKQVTAVFLWKCLSALRIITIPVLIIWWAEQIEKRDSKRQDTFVPAFFAAAAA